MIFTLMDGIHWLSAALGMSDWAVAGEQQTRQVAELAMIEKQALSNLWLLFASFQGLGRTAEHGVGRKKSGMTMMMMMMMMMTMMMM